MKNNNFEYYITVFIIWIILILGIFYLYTNISSTLYWNTEVKNIYEQFNTLQNHWTPTTGIEIVFSVGAQTSGTWTIDNVQLEAGPLATPFERRLVGLELLLCQRYFVSINGATGSGSELNTSAAYIKLPLSTWMRADNQTVTLSTGNSISVDLFGTGTSTTSISNVTILANRVGILFNVYFCLSLLVKCWIDLC